MNGSGKFYLSPNENILSIARMKTFIMLAFMPMLFLEEDDVDNKDHKVLRVELGF